MKVIKSVLFCLLSLVFVAALSSSAQALSSSRKKEYGYNGIFFYDPDWIANGSSSGGPVGCSSISGGPAAEKVWNGLISLGLSEEQAAGIMGNMQHESNFNPAQHEVDGGIKSHQPGFDIAANAGVSYGLGLCQWSFDRRIDLYNHVSSREPGLAHYLEDYRTYSNGFVSGDEFISIASNDSEVNRLIELELDYLKSELDRDYSGLYSTSSVADAAEWFLRNFEKPTNADGQVATRTSAAQGYYDRFHGTASSESSSSSTTDSSASCSATTADGNIIFYQTQEPWGSMPYGSCGDGSTIGTSGCGPTSLAMAITAMTGKTVYPQEIAEKAVASGKRACGSGSSWDITNIATQYGLQVHTISWDEGAISDILRRGGMVQVAGTGSDPFSEGGHFIVIRGITASGNWLIFDSSHEGSDYNTREWEPSEIMSASWSTGTPHAITK